MDIHLKYNLSEQKKIDKIKKDIKREKKARCGGCSRNKIKK